MEYKNMYGGDPQQLLPRSIFASPKTKYSLPRSQYNLSEIIISPRKSNKSKANNLKKEMVEMRTKIINQEHNSSSNSNNQKKKLLDLLLSPNSDANTLFKSSPVKMNKEKIDYRQLFGSPLSNDFFGSPIAPKNLSPSGIKFDVILDENRDTELGKNDFRLDEIYQKADKEIVKEIGKKALVKYGSVKSDPLTNNKNTDQEKISEYNHKFCNNQKDPKTGLVTPFFLKKSTPAKKHIYLPIDDNAHNYFWDQYFDGKTGDCNFRYPPITFNSHTCNPIDPKEGIKLLRFQKLVSDYLAPIPSPIPPLNRNPYRGLLVYHGLGSGKTITSVAVIKEHIEKDPNRNIIVITPPGLRSNFTKELEKLNPSELFGEKWKEEAYEKATEKAMQGINETKGSEAWKKKFSKKFADRMGELFLRKKNKHIYVVSYEELSNRLLGKTPWRVNFQNSCDEKHASLQNVGICGIKYGNRKEDSSKFPILDNCLLVIDEAHKLISPKDKKIKRYSKPILRAIRNANDIKLLLLTATPIDQDPFEIAILINLLKNKNDRNRFPEAFDRSNFFDLEKTKELFNKQYIRLDKDGNTEITNQNDFYRKVSGLISYYSTEMDNTKFAKKEFMPPVKVEMGDAQYKKWRDARNNELKTMKKTNDYSCDNNKVNKCMTTRRLSNFTSSQKKFIIKNISNLKSHSPKLEKIIQNINDNYKNGKQFAYSYWNRNGVYAMCKALEKNGWEHLTPDGMKRILKEKNSGRDIRKKGWNPVYKNYPPLKPKKRFVVLGDYTDTSWAEILTKRIYNESFNKYGEYINLIIGNKKYSEGVTLYHMRAVHILEPPITTSLKEQIIGRAIRNCKHVGLKYPEEWNVKIYTYYSTIPGETGIDIDLVKTGAIVKTPKDSLISPGKALFKLTPAEKSQFDSKYDKKKLQKCYKTFDKCITNNENSFKKGKISVGSKLREEKKCTLKQKRCILEAETQKHLKPKGIEMIEGQDFNLNGKETPKYLQYGGEDVNAQQSKKKKTQKRTRKKKEYVKPCQETPLDKCNQMEMCSKKKYTDNIACSEVSTDMAIDKLAIKKSFPKTKILELLRNSAIDCNAFKGVNEKNITCYRPPVSEKDKQRINAELLKQKENNKKQIQHDPNFLEMLPEHEKIDDSYCAKFKKNKEICQKNDHCSWQPANAILGALGKSSCIKKKEKKGELGNAQCTKYGESKEECISYPECNWNNKIWTGLGNSKCEYKYPKKLRDNSTKNAIVFSNGKNKIIEMKDITNNIVSRQILDYYNDIMKIKTTQKLILLFEAIFNLFKQYQELQKMNRKDFLEKFKEHKDANEMIWENIDVQKYFSKLYNLFTKKPETSYEKYQQEKLKTNTRYLTAKIDHINIKNIKNNSLDFIFKSFYDNITILIDSSNKKNRSINLSLFDNPNMVLTKTIKHFAGYTIKVDLYLTSWKISKIDVMVTTNKLWDMMNTTKEKIKEDKERISSKKITKKKRKKKEKKRKKSLNNKKYKGTSELSEKKKIYNSLKNNNDRKRNRNHKYHKTRKNISRKWKSL